jgi:hypothetical protein
MAKVYVFSTLANDQRYVNWVKGPNDIPTEGYSVFIKGGTGVANDRLITPQGVATEITEEDLAQLEQNPSFMQHKKDGFVTVRAKKAEAEKVAADMNLKDESAPMTHSDYKSEEDSPKYVGA